MDTAPTIYELAGGDQTIQTIVSRFYDKVSASPVLRPLFPEDFTEIRNKQYLFLTQFFGGPMLYSEKYGSPMMRARHMKAAAIAPKHAKAWLQCMQEAIEESGIAGPLLNAMVDRLTKTAHHMVNHSDDGVPHPAPSTFKFQ